MSGSWPQIKTELNALARVRDEGGQMSTAWESYVEVARLSRGQPPYHLRTLVETVDEVGQAQKIADIRILDHGCGAGSVLMYLCAIGYTGIYGIDPRSPNSLGWNRLLREVLGLQEDRFFAFDGGTLPFDDNTFDVVFSQQVLEHVPPDTLDTYYAEEYRVLKPGGVVLHQVPHRLVPYDSHTRTWFVHYLPYGLWQWALRRLGKGSITSESALFLRWPWIHRKKLREVFDHNTDLTIQRLVTFKDFSYYDGPVRLRKAIAQAVALPLVGPIARAALKNLVMIDTLSRKRV